MWHYDLTVIRPLHVQMVLKDIFDPMQSEYELQSVNTPTVSHDPIAMSHDPIAMSHDPIAMSHDPPKLSHNQDRK